MRCRLMRIVCVCTLQDFNAQGGRNHTLGMNHFADWTHAEWLDVMLPNRNSRDRPSLASGALRALMEPIWHHSELCTT